MSKDFKLDTGSRIFHATHPKVAGIRFEWHPITKKIFFIRIGVVPEFGQLVAGGIPNEVLARDIINVWVRGYLEHKAEIAFAIKSPITHGDATYNEKTGEWQA